MSFGGDERVNWALERYDSYRKKSKRGRNLIIIAIAMIILVLANAVGSFNFLPPDYRLAIVGLLGVTSVVLFFLGTRLDKELEEYLPEIEDRLLCFLKPATVALAAFEARHREEDKEKALKHLSKVADLLDEWHLGNLKFVEEGPIGNMLKIVQGNFRDGLLPRLRDAKDGDSCGIRLVVENMEKSLEQTTAVTQYIVETWSKLLLDYPARERSKPFWRKIPTKRSHLMMASWLFGVPAIVGIVASVYINPGVGFLGAIAVWGTLVFVQISVLSKKKND